MVNPDKMSDKPACPAVPIHRFIAAMPRLYSSNISARSFGYEPGKRSWIDKKFNFLAFSFIIRGAGKFISKNGEFHFNGPVMLVEFPGEYYKYGPDSSWDEFYVSYESRFLPVFSSDPWRILRKNILPIMNESFLRSRCNELVGLSEEIGEYGAIDRINQFFEKLVLDVVLQVRRTSMTRESERIYEVKNWIDKHFFESMNFDRLASDFAFSSRGFRRRWHSVIGGTPGEYLMQVRMRHASELLATTPMPIHRVAAESGFKDHLYFSRRFHIQVGEPPSEYRRRNRR